MVKSRPLSRSVRPTAAGSAPKSSRQRPSVRMTLVSLPGVPSSSVKIRPCAGLTRNRRKSDGVATMPLMRVGTPPVAIVAPEKL